MNIFTPPHKLLIALFTFLAISGTITISAQSIIVDSAFTADTQIYPFNQVDTIYGLNISGSIQLNSDTSLVRIIVSDEGGLKWMVFESYPLIASGDTLDFINECDETCYLDHFVPYKLIIQIIDATLSIDSLSLNLQQQEDLPTLQYLSKRNKDQEKIQMMNTNIQLLGFEWVAGDNILLEKYYAEKAIIFGFEGYNLRGFDYYVDGVFTYTTREEIVNSGSNVITAFDWRDKHDARMEGSLYYDDVDHQGWLTSLKNQLDCKTCWVFGTTASFESVIDLYYNNHNNFDLSEQDIFCCESNEGCDSGGYIIDALGHLYLDGAIDDAAQEYTGDWNPSCCGQSSPPEFTIKSTGHRIILLSDKDVDTLKINLLKNGPLITWIYSNSLRMNHVMSLIGYTVTPEDKIDWIFKDSYLNYRPMRLSWEDLATVYCISSSTAPEFVVGEEPDRIVEDKDVDGYYNWGIGNKPANWEPPCGQPEDWNDNNPRIGNADENYYGIPIKPEISVSITTNGIDQTSVDNGDFYFFDMDNCTLTVKISNPGTAQLNLDAFAPVVTIDQEYDPECFVLTGNQPDPKICMNGGYSTFTINFDASDPDLSHIAEVSIHLAESDMDPVFDFALVYNGCGYSTEDHEIRTNTQLAGYHAFQQDIKVCSGYTLEVTGKVAMTENASIFVDQGAQLIINGGTITGSCDKLWKGIDVWGNPYLYQSPANQGLVKIFNGGTVEFAETAIETGKYELPHDFTPSGGIIYCQDAVFKDNIVDVCFHPYQGIYSGLPQPNLSKFEKSLFETTDDLSFLEYSPPPLPDKHVIFNQVNGIHFRGCHFVNYTDAIDTRGIGIFSYEAGYFVEGKCNVPVSPCPDLTPSVFESLNYGIRAFNNTGVYTVSVHDAEFLHNHRGTFMSLVEHPTVVRSNFDLSDPGHFWITDPNIVGLYLENFTTGFQVEENHFNGEVGQENTVGIHILNSGTEQNELYNNTFTSLESGIVAVGENRLANTGVGLCIKCNDFTGNQTDIYVTPEIGEGGPIITQNTGISLKQGYLNETEPYSNSLAAGNTFSADSENDYENSVGCRPIDYTYHGSDPPAYIIPEPRIGDITLYGDDEAEYSKIVSCPSHLNGNINPIFEEAKLIIENNWISLIQDTIQSYLDGGNSESLNYEIISSLPEEAIPLRQSLINKSPYLSDTVMILAIQKEEVLPNAMIRDVLVLNPQSAKSLKILEAINLRHDSMPVYMVNEILEGVNIYGALEILEQQKGRHIIMRDAAWHALNIKYKLDTLDVTLKDSLLVLKQNEDRINAKYNIALIHLNQNDSLNAFSILQSIPLNYDLSDVQLTVHDKYIELFNIIWQINQDSIGIDSLQFQSLSELSTNYHCLPSIYASNYLIFQELISYQESVYLPNLLKRSEDNERESRQATQIEPLIIFPNPSLHFFIIQYNQIGSTGNSKIIISDLTGRFIGTYTLTDWQNQIIVTTLGISAGIYLVELYNDFKLISSKKITILR